MYHTAQVLLPNYYSVLYLGLFRVGFLNFNIISETFDAAGGAALWRGYVKEDPLYRATLTSIYSKFNQLRYIV